jgi:predicted transcriptional regulator
MSKTVTLRLDDKVYSLLRNLAESENRPLSNFIETSVLRYVESSHLVDEYEMAEILNNQELNSSLKRGVEDAKAKRGRFVG